ncbi:dTDP-4-dehydrorhamnose 3,5-epimerase [Reichenbachiella agariperforans]|uniref:dTDP-4-dehydrorhamnose 3,5-epimerase n=1 Tax=Reichenbachiella agariperforans TaxID=156994 RepID=A0A1M6NUV8_REIAG|nr:dTDP-4-dehydrorhamnose 3,5-epimerase [Reichenbachiella agariperforans]SHJ99517.1 dTDP-4-dehydrorhamnose 3,5-epimerase [Reichenbachiella agariperforans]
MKIVKTKLLDAVIIEPAVFGDDRGYFFEGFNEEQFNKLTNQDFKIVQLNFSKSSKGVLRGLHFQRAPQAQAKLVSVINGEVWDVAVDLRKNSKTYGQWHGEYLSAQNKKRFFIPRGFAHGFVALTDDAELMYAVDNHYSKEYDDGVIFNDPSLDIDWKFDPLDVKLSEKDEKLSKLNQ